MDCRIGGNGALHYFSCFQFHDEEDIPCYHAESSRGEEVAGKEVIPMRAEKLFPGEGGLYSARFPEMSEYFTDGFMGNCDVKFVKLVPDAPCAPEGILFFQFQDKFFYCPGNRRPARAFMNDFNEHEELTNNMTKIVVNPKLILLLTFLIFHSMSL